MEKKDLRKDMAVFLSHKCKYTERFFGWNEKMDQYKGTVRVIDSFSTSSISHCRVGFYNTRFNWSVRDLEFIPKSPKPKSIRFDEKELCL